MFHKYNPIELKDESQESDESQRSSIATYSNVLVYLLNTFDDFKDNVTLGNVTAVLTAINSLYKKNALKNFRNEEMQLLKRMDKSLPKLSALIPLGMQLRMIKIRIKELESEFIFSKQGDQRVNHIPLDFILRLFSTLESAKKKLNGKQVDVFAEIFVPSVVSALLVNEEGNIHTEDLAGILPAIYSKRNKHRLIDISRLKKFFTLMDFECNVVNNISDSVMSLFPKKDHTILLSQFDSALPESKKAL